MSNRIGVLSRVVVPWPALVLAAIVSVAVGLAVARTAPSPAPAGSPGLATQGLAGVPDATRSALSALLGAQNPGYLFRSRADGFAAGNRAQGLRVSATRGGVWLDGERARLGLSLAAAGYGSSLRSLPRASPAARANRITFARGNIQEWYVNGPFGVEQGFTVVSPPAGDRQQLPLTLSIRLSGDMRASLRADGRSVTLSKAGARSLRYGGLAASDATGHPLRTWMALDDSHRLVLRVDTAGARYPVTIDPTVFQTPESKLSAADESGEAHFGYSVALSADGNTALIGGPRDTDHFGAVWVFVRTNTGWAQQGPKLEGGEQVSEATGEHCGEAGEEEDDCGFGRRVALSADGNTALVGNPRDSRFEPPSGEQEGRWVKNVGAAWVFVREGETWRQMGPKLTADDEGGQGRFGKSVALSADGSTALIGGPSDAAGRGSAWSFSRVQQSETWVQDGGKLGPSGAQGEAHFGISVALAGDGNTALVGAPSDSSYRGAAWVFERSGGHWSEGPELTGTEQSEGARFGYSVAVSADGSTALVGARGDDGGRGAAWVFGRSGSSWPAQSGKLAGEEEGEEFGYSVALTADGGAALIGAPRENHARGAALLYLRSGTSWGAPAAKLEGSVEETGRAWLGASVALAEGAGTAVVGGPSESSGHGAAWVFGPSPRVTGLAPHGGPNAGGTSVTISGSNFEGASAVHFGSASASFTVNSANAITAVSPPGEGVVDVTVTTPFGTSTTSTFDQFKYGMKGTPGTPKPPAVKTPVVEPTTTLTPTGGVLGYGPTGGDCRVALVKRSVVVSSRGRVSFRLRVTGSGRCRGKLRLRVTRKLAPHHTKVKTIGTAVFSIVSGHSATVTVKLNAAGRARLAAGHGRLRASLLIVRQSPMPLLARASRVSLAAAKRHAVTAPKA